jgi:AcrR family transcriptional regulator
LTIDQIALCWLSLQLKSELSVSCENLCGRRFNTYAQEKLNKLESAMPRPKTGDKRTAIILAAIEAIAECGVGASTAGIAKAAAIGEGSLFRYFPDKETLLNELYRELKIDVQRAMIDGFPVTASLQGRVQHIWDAYISWGIESPAKRKTMTHLTVSDRITKQTREEGQEGFGDAIDAIRELVTRGKLSDLPPKFASDLLLAMAETTMTSMAAYPKEAERYRALGFKAFWSAAGKNEP